MALTETDATSASLTGGILETDEQAGVEVAGFGKPVLELMRELFAKVPSNVDAGAVPVPITEPIIKVGEPSYRDRQDELAPKLLSPEGQTRFEEAGRSGRNAVFPPQPDPVVDAARAAMPDEAVISDATRQMPFLNADGSVRAGSTDVDQSGAATAVDAESLIAAQQKAKIEDAVRAGDGGIDGVDFNFQNIETGEDVKQLFNYVSDLHSEAIDTAKRGVQTNEETKEQAGALLADELGLTKRLLKRKTGDMLNAAQMTAARILLVKSGERLTVMATKIRDGQATALEMVEFRRHMAIHAGIHQQAKAAQTEIARALQAFNIPVSANTPEARADFAQTLLNESGGADSTEALARGMLAAREKALKYGRNPNAAANKYAEKGAFALSRDAVYEIVINGMLSWFPTHAKNALATPLFMMFRSIEEVTAGIYGTGERAVKKTLGKPVSDDEVYIGQAVARMYGQVNSLRDAFITAGQTWKLEAAADAMSKVQGAQFKAIDAGTFRMENGFWANAVNVLGRIIRYPGRALQTADDFWKTISSYGENYALAYNAAARAKALGKTDQEAADDAAMILLDPRSSARKISASARYDTMTSETGKLGEYARIMQNKPLARLYIPFTTAPTNSILRTVERTPLGLLAGMKRGPDGNYLFKNAAARQMIMARVSVGSAAMYTMHTYAMEGRFTGSFPPEQRQREMLPPGWRPYSLVERGENWPLDSDGDPLPLYNNRGIPNGALVYTSYAGLEPISMLLGIAAETAEQMRRSNLGTGDLTDLPSAAIGATMQYIGDMPMLATLGEMYEAFKNNSFARFFGAPLPSTVPYSAAVRSAIERPLDPVKRRPSKDLVYFTQKDVDAMPTREDGSVRIELVGTIKNISLDSSLSDFGAAMSEYRSLLLDRVIYGGSSDETSAIQYDILGREKEHNVRFDVNPVLAAYNIISPFKRTEGKPPSYIETTLMRLNAPLREKVKKKNGMRFDDAFVAKWTNAAKNTVTVKGLKFRPALSKLIGSWPFTRLAKDPKGQIALINKLENQFFDAGFKAVIWAPEHADELEAYNDRKAVNEYMNKQGILR